MTASLLLLASASPRRHAILTQLGIAHRVLSVPAPEGEDEPQLPAEPPEHYVRRTAREKAVRARDWLQATVSPDPQAPFILAADTCVILDGEILGKPADPCDAARSLKRLSGRRHEVHTALALIHGAEIHEAVSISTVEFAVLDAVDIRRYCDSGEAMGKAGAYAIQGRAGAFVRHLSGSYTGVMGLPAYETIALLRQAGFVMA